MGKGGFGHGELGCESWYRRGLGCGFRGLPFDFGSVNEKDREKGREGEGAGEGGMDLESSRPVTRARAQPRAPRNRILCRLLSLA